MRPYVIVTLRSAAFSGTYDLEIPTDTAAGRLVKDIAETISSYRGEPSFPAASYGLYCERLGRMIHKTETFAEAGIWSGDIIEMKGKD